MCKKVEIEVDTDLAQEVISRHRLADAREAIHLALRTLLGETHDAAGQLPEDEYDEFSGLSAWHLADATKRGDPSTDAVTMQSHGLETLHARLYPPLGPRHDWSLRVKGPLSSVGRAFPW
jgi:Arc/MetJ family transcription regulator